VMLMRYLLLLRVNLLNGVLDCNLSNPLLAFDS